MTRLLLLAVCVSLAQGATRYTDLKNLQNIQFKPDLDDEIRLKQIENCPTLVTPEIRAEIESHREIAADIIRYAEGTFSGRTYQELHDFLDKHPVRLSGEQNLEDSIDYAIDRMTNEHGFANVRGEQVLVPHWVRGEESAEMQEPWIKNLRLLGLGTTVGTPVEGITAEVLVVTSFDDLDSKRDQVRGKIVVYNQGWTVYGDGYIYRNQGASRASQYGAVATLIRSIAPFSLDTPHTGGQNYLPWNNATHIPTACITIEDAELMQRLSDKGDKITVILKMLDYNLPMTTSRNVIGELVGTSIPHEIVAVSGHIDSWDLGQGAMDDGGGCMISVMALALLKEMGLIPKRTLQVILWTSEEPGLWGAEDFVRQHDGIMQNYSAAFESDSGTFEPLGLDFAGSETAGCIVYEILKLMQCDGCALNATTYTRYDSVSTDIGHMIDKGVPGLSLNNANDNYFWYHHTEADTISMMDSGELDRGTAIWAAASYIIANLNEKLPRD